jgi:D-alanine-D-alanine ligase
MVSPESSSPLCVALLFGGMSSEHEISRVSAGTFVQHIDRANYELLTIGITRGGEWLYTEATAAQMADGSWESLPGNMPCAISPDRATHGAILFTPEGHVEKLHIDVVIPALHGLWGEDGTVQGLLELAGIPYVGCGVLASAACMDKAVANALFEANGVPHCKWASYSRFQLRADPEGIRAALEQKLDYPIFVKPANAGSSVGISRAANADELREAIEVALREDRKLVFEAAVDGQEVECAAIGNQDGTSTATLPGEILAGAEFYTYDDKYKNGVSQTLIPARLPADKLAEVRDYAVKAYNALGCEGLARCDFFVERGTGRVLINEINTFPGFTSISMYPKLMEQDGLDTARLIDRLIALALERTAN